MGEVRSIHEAGGGDLQRAQALLEAGKLEEAIILLESLSDPSGGASALIGAAYYRLEDYPRAAAELRKALVARPSDKNLGRLYARALANSEADVQRPVPEPYFFDKETLLQG